MGIPVKKNIILLGAGFTTPNMGVWALASGAVTAAWHAYPDANISILDYSTEPIRYTLKRPTGTSVVPLINIRFSKKFWLPNNIARLLLSALLIKVVPARALRNRLYSRNYWLRHIQEADIVGSIAGGDSFSDIYGLRRLIYVTLPQLLALFMDKPLILLPQTIGPFDTIPGKILERYILKHAMKVHSRDQEGLNRLHEILGRDDRRAAFCHDMAFVLDPKVPTERIPTWLADIDLVTPVVGINVSGLLYIGGYTGKNMFGLKSDYRKLIHALIGLFVQKYKAHVMLVPHVLGNLENSESDVAACHKIFYETRAELQDHLHVVEDGYDHHELKALIGRCDFFLGSRMHACIAALSQCIPAVGLAYSKKFKGVFDSVGVQEMVLDLRWHDDSSIVNLVDSLFQRRAEFGDRLEAKMPEVRASIMALFADIITPATKYGK